MPERQFVERIRRLSKQDRPRALIRGIGDDCAILQIRPGGQVLVTTDLCVEDVHFRRQWHPAPSVGHRCLARGLSDIAAMGGEPLACFLSLGVPPDLPQKWIDEFLRGLLQLAHRFRVSLAGGDTSSAQKITADILLLGTVPAGEALLRSKARPSDWIFVTGKLGGSAAVLECLYAGRKVTASMARSHFYPEPRLEVARRLRRGKMANAMIDLSDGLSVDLAHICQESGVSALIEAKSIPLGHRATLDLALHGGEDYELLFTAPQRLRLPSKIAGIDITPIGKILPRSSRRSVVRIRDANGHTRPLPQGGWQHFDKN